VYCHIITNSPQYSGLNPFKDRINISPYASKNEEEVQFDDDSSGSFKE